MKILLIDIKKTFTYIKKYKYKDTIIKEYQYVDIDLMIYLYWHYHSNYDVDFYLIEKINKLKSKIKKKKIKNKGKNIQIKKVFSNLDNTKSNKNIRIHNNKLSFFHLAYNYKKMTLLRHKYHFDYRLRHYIRGLQSWMTSTLNRYLVNLDSNLKNEFLFKFNNDFNWNNFQIKDLNSQYILFYICTQVDDSIKSLTESNLLFEKYNYNIHNLFNLNPNNHNILKLKLDKLHSTVSIDATSSMLQIIGCLIKDKKLMKYTNVFYQSKKYDLYYYMIEKYYLDNKKYTKHHLYFLLIDRNFIKNVIMTYVYGSNARNIARDLKDKFDLHIIINKDDLIELNQYIINDFDKEFPKIKKIKHLCNLINKINPINMNLIYKCPSIHDNKMYKEINYNIAIKKKYNIMPIQKENEKIDMFVSFQDYDRTKQQISLEDKQKSFFVNTIHSFDAFIAFYVKKKLYKNNITCYSIHDNFLFQIQYYEQVINFYNEAMNKIYNNWDFIKILNFYSPSYDLDKSFDKFINKIVDWSETSTYNFINEEFKLKIHTYLYNNNEKYKNYYNEYEILVNKDNKTKEENQRMYDIKYKKINNNINTFKIKYKEEYIEMLEDWKENDKYINQLKNQLIEVDNWNEDQDQDNTLDLLNSNYSLYPE